MQTAKPNNMELIKIGHNPSHRVKRSNRLIAEHEARELVDFLDNGNGEGFKGEWRQALAISHNQVEAFMPYRMFVVNADLFNSEKKKMTRAQNRKNWYFPSRVIFNAEVVNAPEKVKRVMPKREIIRDGKEARVEVTRQLAEISNILEVDEACMSFPNRSKRKMKRYHTLTVKYQVLRSFLGFKWFATIVEEVEGLKAHIFQHEIDHSLGIDMFHGDGGADNMRNTVRDYKKLQTIFSAKTKAVATGYVDADNKTITE